MKLHAVQQTEARVICAWASLVALVVENPPANAEGVTDIGSSPGSGRSPGGAHATHSSILAWRMQRTEEPGGGSSPLGGKQSDISEATSHKCKYIRFYFFSISKFITSLPKTTFI